MTDYTKLIERLCEYKDYIPASAEAAEAIEAMQKEVSTLDVLLEECKMDWSGDVTQLKAEHKHEIEALQAECAEHKENAIRNARIAVSIRAERDQLQSKLGDAIQSSAHWQHQFTEAQAENERLNSGWHQANQEALQAKLTVQVQAKNIVLLCDDLKYIAGIARRLGMPVDDDNLKVRAAILGAVQLLEAERDAMGKGEPVAPEQVEAAWRAGWASCRDAEYVGQEAEDEAWGMSQTCANADWESAAPKVLAPLKWAPEEIGDGMRGIRWVMPEGVCGRPTDHDVREYLLRTETACGCQCDDCKAFYGIGGTP